MIFQRFYVASSTSNIREVRMAQNLIRGYPHFDVTYDWTANVEEVGGPAFEGVVSQQDRQRFAANDLTGVYQADFVVCLSHPTMMLAGTWVEFGAALAWGKPVWWVGDPPRDTVFLALPGVRRFPHAGFLSEALMEIHKLYTQSSPMVIRKPVD